MIRLSEYSEDIDELSRGDTASVCHSDCPAGEDTRFRLYLTKPASSPNVVLGYCHNCNESGILRDADDTPYRDFDKAPAATSKQVAFDVPDNMVSNPSYWPDAATAWRIAKRLDAYQCQGYRIEYDPATHRMYLPIYRYIDEGRLQDLVGYQLRVLDGKGPKYLTAQKEQDTVLYTVMRPYPAHTDTYVLVEDMASGIAIMSALYDRQNKYKDCDHIGVLINYGVKTKIEALNDCYNIKLGYVWLDNDGPHIYDQSKAIAKTWSLVAGGHMKQNTFNFDPKQYTNNEILHIMEEDGLWASVT